MGLPAPPFWKITSRMSLLRTSRVLPQFARQVARVAGVQTQRRRGYAEMSFTLASPASVYYNEASVKQVDVPSFSGSFGILPDDVPSLAVLKPGVITVYEDSATKKFFASSGSVTINDDSSVQILAEECVAVEDLDSAAIRDGLSRANQEMNSASSDTARAEAQIQVECFEALQKAVDGQI